MSEKIRVIFSVSGQTVGKPIEISDADYVRFKIGQRDGYNMAMALFVSDKFLNNQQVDPDSVSMIKAVGAPMWVFDIDRAVENHEDYKLYQAVGMIPAAGDMSSVGRTTQEPPKPNVIDKFLFKYIPKWEIVEFKTRQLSYCIIAIVLAFFIIGACSDSSEDSNVSYQDKFEKIKNNASGILD
ncbi:hypothetical protein [uncultured Duncaniella sp.]|uniref:hypothetical protein n=1 Tax=uncultured Duncaniella sp. TaxID=2768039 RepID=UPI00272D89BE|nr:hypothetical protein [uncultured Duncaniella sp.]